MTMKVAISVGHNPRKPGASFKNKTEYSETILMAAFAIQHLQRDGHHAFLIGTGSLKKKVDEINSLGVDCAVEIHLNKAGGVGHGCETLYCPGSIAGESLANDIHAILIEATGNRDRGVKPGWHRMDQPGVEDYPGDIDGDEKKDYFLEKTNCPAVIIEPYFIDTEDKMFSDHPWLAEKIGMAIKLGLENWKGGK